MYSMLNSIQSHYYLYFIETFHCGPIKFGFEYPCFIFGISSPDVGTRYITGVFHTQNILIFNNIKIKKNSPKRTISTNNSATTSRHPCCGMNCGRGFEWDMYDFLFPDCNRCYLRLTRTHKLLTHRTLVFKSMPLINSGNEWKNPSCS